MDNLSVGKLADHSVAQKDLARVDAMADLMVL